MGVSIPLSSLASTFLGVPLHARRRISHELRYAGILAYGEVSRGQKILYSGTNPESYITEYFSIRRKYKCIFSTFSVTGRYLIVLGIYIVAGFINSC